MPISTFFKYHNEVSIVNFLGAYCMFKSNQFCFCHICKTQYLSVRFVKKGTTI